MLQKMIGIHRQVTLPSNGYDRVRMKTQTLLIQLKYAPSQNNGL